MYTAAKIMPVAAKIVKTGPKTDDLNAPNKMVNSPINPFKPGKPMEESATTMEKAP